MMVHYITLILFDDLVDARECFDLTDRFVCKDAVKDTVRCAPAIISSRGFLVQLELLLINCLVRLFQWIDFLYIFVLVVHDDHIRAKGCLNCLHPVSMDDGGCDFVLCGSGVHKAEFEHF
jgi:hypothetical protein